MANNKDTKKLFILDTNVLIHDPSAIYRFQEHDVYIPIVVLEELDNNKKGITEVARSARQASRFLEELIKRVDIKAISNGIELYDTAQFDDEELHSSAGKLYFQTENFNANKSTLPDKKNDNIILGVALELIDNHAKEFPSVILVTKDINMRIKAAALCINVDDYQNDQVLENIGLLYRGYDTFNEEFWGSHAQDKTWNEEGRVHYKFKGDEFKHCYPNQFLKISSPQQDFECIVREVNNESTTVIVEQITNYTNSKNNVWGINARNDEQNYALNLLMDQSIDFVSLEGQAGTGKTLLTLAAGLAQVFDKKVYTEIIMTRATVSVGDDIGFLPGTEEEKMTPWMGSLTDNLEFLSHGEEGNADNSEWERMATNDLVSNKIKIRSLNFMRGRTFLNRYVIIDEAQNLTSKQMKTLITRAGPGTKIICLGNNQQIDTIYLSDITSGLTYTVDRFKQWEYSGHVTLKQGERSRLADYASENL